MYTDTDSTTYATITNTNASTSSRFLYLRGFNFSDIPANAIINSFTIKIKGYESGLATGTSYAPRLANGTSAISNTTATTNFGTSSKTIQIPTGSLTWNAIVNTYGSNFTILIYVRRSSKNTTGYAYIQGAEIEVDYTLPVYHNVTVSGENATPSGQNSVLEGSSFTVKCMYDERPTVTDNGTDVSSQLVQQQESPESYSVANISTTYGFALNNNGYYESNNKAQASSCALARVSFHMPVAGTVTFSVINYAESTYDYGLLSNIDAHLSTSASADSSNVYWNGKNNNSSSVQTVTYQMTAGDHTIDVKYFKDSYTDSNNDSLQFKVAIVLSETPTYDTYWVYTIASVTTDHTIVVAATVVTPPVITVGTPSRIRISDETGYDQCVCTFASDIALQAWEARATKAGVTPARGVGLLVESGGALAANTNATIYVDDEELTQGDGEYTITVYGQSTGGVWSE